jgi:MFS family permease
MTGESTAPISTNIPARLDRLAWSRWHTMVVVALGITWILDGLEVTIVGALGSVLEHGDTLGLTSAQVGLAASAYLAGAISGALVFGRLTDLHGRKRLFIITLSMYVVATLSTAGAWSFASFAIFRFFTGAAIGGEYAAINSAIDELLPARVRGFVALAINGSYWVGTALGALSTTVLLNPRIFPPNVGWRVAFALGAILAVAIVLVRRFVPESPRWLLLHGRPNEADAVATEIERHSNRIQDGDDDTRTMRVVTGRHYGYADVARVLFRRYPRRAWLCFTLMVTQAFFYNSIFFSYSLILTKFFRVAPQDVGRYLLPFAIGNFLGPLLLGRAFDAVGRKTMIAITYAISGVLLLATGGMFVAGWLDASTQTLAWSVVFFFGSAAASSAYLSASELFPLEIRANALAFFYAVGTAVGGLAAPAVFGVLIGSGDPMRLFGGYAFGAGLMLVAAIVAAWLGVPAERKSLESVATPLSAVETDS